MNTTVCSAAVAYANSSARSSWITKFICNGLGPAKAYGGQLSTCLTNSLRAGEEDFAPGLQFSSARDEAEGFLHVIFIDDRPSPDVGTMMSVARMGNGSKVRFVALLRSNVLRGRRSLHEHGFSVLSLDDAALPAHARCVHRGLERLVPKGSKMRGAALYKPMLHWLLPKEMEHALVLDSDTVPLRPLDGLLDEIPKMRRKGALIALVPEQSHFYRDGKHFQMAPGVIGFNGGVQLHDLKSLRSSKAWDTALDALQAGLLVHRIGYSGDQNLYNVIVSLFPHFFHTLGCEWNRQMGSWAMSGRKLSVKRDLQDDSAIHECASPCALLHFNAFKCGAAAMHAASGSCARWMRLLADIDGMSRGSMINATDKTCPDWRSQAWRLNQLSDDHLLGAGYRQWFSGCCIEA